MNTSKLISIVIPVYNTEIYLERCLQSLINQTYRNLQIIVVNDASPGNVNEIMEHYQTIDNRIVYIEHKKNIGVFKARISGLQAANGEYISFVDSDDYIGTDYYRLLISEAEKSQADMVFSRTVLVGQEKTVFGMHEVAFPNEIIDGESIFLDFFLAQEGRCYNWHTLWNKLYKKTLWDKCLIFFDQYKEHINMMEDIACSFPLFYYARKISKVENSVYYYCQNTGSATDAKTASFEKLKKNLADTFRIFEIVEEFLKSINASDKVFSKYYDFRNYYIRDWKNGIEFFNDSEERKVLTGMITSTYGEIGNYILDDRFFRSVRTIWNDDIEEIKKKICNPEYEYISFDIFDTLVTRPFYRPSDLFHLLDKLFEKIYKAKLSFHQIRIDGEISARVNLQKSSLGFQDITIDEIYDSISEIYGIPANICSALREEEKRLEIFFCTIRKTTKELFDLAKYSGKKIILVSDMYLDKSTIESILHKNGYTGYERIFLSSEERLLKHTGDLFKKVLGVLKVDGSKILHIGDNHYCDVTKANEAGLHTVYLPRTINVFENKVKELDTRECSTLAQNVSGVILDGSRFLESVGYGSMIAIVANHYFDNPFRPFNSESDYNADPYFIGYYALGMHLAGLINWILQQSYVYKRILFMARDGFLVKQAYDIWTASMDNTPVSDYVYASRKMLLPASIENTADFFNLPIVYSSYNAISILELLDFCTNDTSEEIRSAIFEENKIQENLNFKTKNEYFEFMKFYLKYFYNEEKHNDSKQLLKEYYDGISNADIIFDIGYTGSVPYAFKQISGKSIDALFVYSSIAKTSQMSRKGNFKIKTFYDFTPEVPMLLREHVLSAPHPSCIGLNQKSDKIIPIFEDTEKSYTDTFVINRLHEGALQFIKDFSGYFRDYLDYTMFKSYEVSMPFEAFLRIPTGKDLQIFESSYFEDKVYGRQNAINIARYIENYYKSLPQYTSNNMVESLRDSLIDNIKYNRKLVCFGTGKKCREFLSEYPDIPVSFFLDNDRKLAGTYLNNKEIRHPEQVDNWNSIYIIITTYYSSEIEKQLRNLGLEKYKNFISFQELFGIA